MNYDSALDRAFESLPERPSAADSRLSVPDPEGETDGAFTRLTNLDAIADALSRDAEHLHRSIQRDLGTNGQFEGGRARYNGSFSIADFDAALKDYTAEYVTCSECGLPDTNLVKEDGVDMLRCEACGAFRPVAKGGSNRAANRTRVQSGRSYELEITDVGRKGDGVAHRGDYTIFVPGAEKGDTVTAYIKNTSGSLAFARRT